jgi:hypothetical protein
MISTYTLGVVAALPWYLTVTRGYRILVAGICCWTILHL